MNFNFKDTIKDNYGNRAQIVLDNDTWTIQNIEGNEWNTFYPVFVDDDGRLYYKRGDGIVDKVYFTFKITGRSVKYLYDKCYFINVKIFTNLNENREGFLGKLYLSF